MSRDETALELERLRAEVAALSEAKRDAAKADEPAIPPPAPEPAVDHEEARSQLEELGTLLEAEVRDLPTVTTLAVFTLGLLIGRMLR